MWVKAKNGRFVNLNHAFNIRFVPFMEMGDDRKVIHRKGAEIDFIAPGSDGGVPAPCQVEINDQKTVKALERFLEAQNKEFCTLPKSKKPQAGESEVSGE